MEWEHVVASARREYVNRECDQRGRVRAYSQALEAELRARGQRVGDNVARELSQVFESAAEGSTQTGADARQRALAAWDHPAWDDLSWASTTAHAGTLVRAGTLTHVNPPRGWQRLRTPLVLPLLCRRNLLVNVDPKHRGPALDMIQSIVLRVLATATPGTVHIVGIDPRGLGSNLACLTGLNTKIRGGHYIHTTHDIKSTLSHLNQLAAVVIQDKLVSRYPNLAEYNVHAEHPDPQHIVVITDYPTGFDNSSNHQLAALARVGSRAGITLVIHAPTDRPERRDEGSWRDILDSSTCVDDSWFDGSAREEWRVTPDSIPSPTQLQALLESINEGMAAGRVTTSMRSRPRDIWTHESTDMLAAPIGRDEFGASVEFELGRAQDNHALVVGTNGTGKSVSIHNLILSLAERYSPLELEFYLLDFKGGVELAPYVDLPHLRVFGADGDRGFGLSVLEALDRELSARAELFRSVPGAVKPKEYRSRSGKPLSRILLIIDECQMLFAEQDRIGMGACAILDRLARQGRAFGIHILLASQTISASQLSPSTLAQMTIRLLLPLSERDAHLLLGADAKLLPPLGTPGAALFINSSARTRIQGPNVTQDEVAKSVLELKRHAQERGISLSKRVLGGDADVSFDDNEALGDLLAGGSTLIPRYYDLYFGQSMTVSHDHARWRMRRQSRGNFLVAGTDATEACAAVITTVGCIAAAYPASRVVLINAANVDEDAYEDIQELRSWPLELTYGRQRDAGSACAEVHGEFTRRREAYEATPGKAERPPPLLFVLFGLQGIRAFDGSSRGVNTELIDLLSEGPDVGIHMVVWVDRQAHLGMSIRTKLNDFGGLLLLYSASIYEFLPSERSLRPQRGYAYLADLDGGSVTKLQLYREKKPGAWFLPRLESK